MLARPLALVVFASLTIMVGNIPAQDKTESHGKIAVIREWKGFHCGVDKPAQLVIRDAKSWADLWGKIHSNVTPKPPVPELDFDKYQVLAVFLGQKPTGGYSIRIRDITPDTKTGKLLATLEELSPPPGSIVIQVLTQPYHVVVIPKTDKEIEFRRQ